MLHLPTSLPGVGVLPGRPPGVVAEGPIRPMAHTHRNLGRGNLPVPVAAVQRLFLIDPAWATCSPLAQSRLRGSGLLSALLPLWGGVGRAARMGRWHE